MKFFLLISQIFALSAFANQRNFECQWTSLQAKTLQELNLSINLKTQLTFTERKQSWNLKFGDLDLSTSDANGPALNVTATISNDQLVVYDFWVDGSYEYSLQIDLDTINAKLFWFGTGEEMLVGDLQCDVEENP